MFFTLIYLFSVEEIPMKKSVKYILIAVAALLVAAVAILAVNAQNRADSEVIPEAGTSENADRPTEFIQWEDRSKSVKRHIETLLIIGTDEIEGRYETPPDDIEMYYNEALCDLLIVLVLDNDAKTVTPFQLNRDTMCEVPWISVNGKVGGTNVEQICYAHTYGSGSNDSCENTVSAVSSLIFDAPIDHYISFTMDAVPLLNDLVGGVTVTLPEDMPELGDEYTAGAEITLKGSAALNFVRYRNTALLDSNLPRMSRQRLYLEAFLPVARDSVEKNQDLVTQAFKVLDPYLCMDMTVNDISDMVEKLCEYEILPVITADGQYRMGEKYAEFYVDNDSLYECTVQAFCD